MSSNRFNRLACRLAALASMATLAVTSAQAATFTVGPLAQGCTHATPQDAVIAAQGTAGGDTIRISRLQAWTAQQINIDTAQDLDIVGGFPDCSATTPTGTNTTLDGTGGQARPVITIRGNGIVNLRRLDITGGDQGSGDNGGGVFYQGGGILAINDCGISNNLATDGGGIYAQGTSTIAELLIGANVSIGFNRARNSGGGIYSKSIETSIIGPGSTLIMNEALGQGGGTSGGGGGLAVVSAEFTSTAYVSSNGIGGVGAIFGNRAVYGGGVAVVVGPESNRTAEVRVFSKNADEPVRINGNTAVLTGGGIYAKSDGDVTAGSALAYVRLWHAAIDGNTAADGAAISMDRDTGGIGNSDTFSLMYFNRPGDPPLSPPVTSVPCAVGRPCGYIRDNTVTDPNGSVILVQSSFADFDRVEMTGNGAARLLNVSGEIARISIANSLIADNDFAQEVIYSNVSEADTTLTLGHVTIAGNTIGGPNVLEVSEKLRMHRSLIFQPGRTTLAAGGGTRSIDYVLSNSVTNMGGGAFFLANPRFIDPARGDYHLRAGAYAVDFAPFEGASADLDGRSHSINMPLGGIGTRASDVGAFERPALQPLVLNATFDTDLNLWDFVSASSWDGTQNSSGPQGSGSLRGSLAIDDETVALRRQCVHLPGPGTYRLDGLGRVTDGAPNDNTVRLEWELRYDGSAEGCSNNAVASEGFLVLSRTPTWTRPLPAEIVVPAASWTRNTSLTIYAVVINGNPVARGANATAGADVVGWFDGVRLEVDLDALFEDGFE